MSALIGPPSVWAQLNRIQRGLPEPPPRLRTACGDGARSGQRHSLCDTELNMTKDKNVRQSTDGRDTERRGGRPSQPMDRRDGLLIPTIPPAGPCTAGKKTLPSPISLRGIAAFVLGALLWLASSTSSASSPPPVGGSPRRLALLVGIGDYYQGQGDPARHAWPILHVEAEIREYAEVLSRDYGFARGDVRILLNEDATLASIRAALRQLVQSARPGDIVVFHFSGHGQRLPDDAAQLDEPDGLDESLVTFDATDQSVETGVRANLRDDELASWLRQLADRMRPAPGQPVQGNITVTMDACFSGAATRGSWVARGRDWDLRLDGPLPPPRAAGNATPAAGLTHLFDQASAGESLRDHDISVLAAARADQVAWERDGQGAFTRAWVRFLASHRNGPAPTYLAAAQRLHIDLHARGVPQDPVAIGAATRQLFGGLVPPQPLEFPVLKDRQDQLWLQVGEVHGVALGSRYALHPAGLARADASTLLGTADVVELAPFASRLRLLPGAVIPLPEALVAVEIERAMGLSRLRVLWGGDPIPAEVIAVLQELAAVQLVAGGQSPSASRDDDYDLTLCYDAVRRCVVLSRPAARRPHGEVCVDQDGLVGLAARLRKTLLAEWRWRHFALLHFKNDSAHIDIEVVPHPGTAFERLDSASVRVPSGSSFSLRLTNRSDQTLYAAVIALSPDGDIDVLVGNQDDAGKNRISSGHTWGTGTQEWKIEGSSGDRVLLKVVATDEFVSFSAVHSVRPQTTTRGAPNPAAQRNPLALLIDGLQGGSPPAQVRGAPIRVPSHWGTSDGVVEVR